MISDKARCKPEEGGGVGVIEHTYRRSNSGGTLDTKLIFDFKDDERMVQFSIDQELNKYDTDHDGHISLDEFENSGWYIHRTSFNTVC